MRHNLNIILPPHEMDCDEEIVIRKAGFYEHIKYHSVHRQRSACLEEAVLIYCIDGSGWFEAEGVLTTIKHGMLIFCDKNAAHAYGSNEQTPWSILWVHFNGPFCTYFSTLLETESQCRILDIGYQTNLTLNLQQIIQLLRTSTDTTSRLTANSYLKASLCEILLYDQQTKVKPLMHDEFIQKSISIMHKQIDSSLTLDQLSHSIGFSKFYFSRRFKQATGISPMQYFNRLKIEKACTLLAERTYTTHQISELLGFSTPNYFSELFKQITGFSPREYTKLQELNY